MILIIFSLFILLFLNVPVAFALAGASLIFLIAVGKYPLILIVQQMFNGTDSFVFLAVPFFILSGTIMERGGISEKLVSLSSAIMDRFTGGFAMATSLASMIFASISGSGPATTAAIGGITIPALVERGYHKAWVTGFQAAAGSIGPIIPPSITMVIFGAMAGTSIGALFIAGIVPGILVGISLMVSGYFHAKNMGVPKLLTQYSLQDILRYCKEALWALGMPVLILGGILGGVFTPTEAAVVAVVYALIISFAVYRTLKISDIPGIFMDSAVISAVIMIILANAAGFAWILSAEQGPQTAVAVLKALTENKYITLFIINVALLILGCFIDTTSILIMTVPVLVPIANSMGIDLVHLGCVITVNLCIGMVTPPLGLTLFTACAMTKISIAETTKWLFPIIMGMLVVLAIVTYFPSLVLFLPRLLMK
jgi:C4-dicarboxylate transporter DctM subunit